MAAFNFEAFSLTPQGSTISAAPRPAAPAIDRTIQQQCGSFGYGNRAFQFDFASLESLPEDANPGLTEVLTAKYWNHFSIQLGHWNTLKVIVLDAQMFSIMPDHTKKGVLNTMKSYLGGADAMYARDADNGQVVILGPRRLMESNITIVGSTTVWDPKKRHVQATAEAKIPRPPNAYILYRKDQQAALKAANPGIPNNDISVMTGGMWKKESPEVRAEYQRRATEIKAKLMSAHPHYRYVPRRSSEIRRRAPRRNRAQEVANASPIGENSGAPIVGNPIVTTMEQQQPLPDISVAPNQEITKDNDVSHLIDPPHVFSGQITELMPDVANFLPPMTREGWSPLHDFRAVLNGHTGNNGVDCALTPESESQDEFVGTPSSTMPDNSAFDWITGTEEDLAQIFGQF
ncbi:MAT+ sexual cell fertilization-promoting factor encoded by the FPR1 gene [Podospora comata]|uniref:MAT+ sexual cell fertilization-promoting factor encoded by the FPR1 protein n=1 Tax=Podospora comata TaxID=48703 RepID=A0ABY6RZ58_PODCO|nr:MAT+ sexual cell fertilization-promoting factor encoded by the FPR1 gene [Podospora comata]